MMVLRFVLVQVDLRTLFVSPWQTQSVVWSRLLDAVRYLVVWNPLIVIVCQVSNLFSFPVAFVWNTQALNFASEPLRVIVWQATKSA